MSSACKTVPELVDEEYQRVLKTETTPGHELTMRSVLEHANRNAGVWDVLYNLTVDYFYFGWSSVTAEVDEIIQLGVCYLRAIDQSTRAATLLEERAAIALKHYFADQKR